MSDPALADLATQAGLQIDWRDAAGQAKTVPDATLRLILDAIGLPCATAADLADSRARIATRNAAPADFVTADAGRAIPLAGLGAAGRARLTLETGEARDIDLGAGPLSIAEPGYHRLEFGGREITVAVAPARAFAMQDAAPGRRAWGVGVQIYGLKDARGEPFGDFGALARFVEAAGRAGADAAAISPTHALFAADASRYSPYGPSTRLFLNGLYADPSGLFPEAWTPAGGADGGDLIDWASAIPAKLERLRRLHDAFDQETSGPRRADFEAFRTAGGRDLERHAVFEALHGRFFRETGAHGWPDWPAPYQDPDSPAVAAFAREAAAEVDFHLFLQWLADRSLAAAQAAAKGAGMAVGLIADLAVGMDPGGSHAWSRRSDLVPNLSVGAPPDPLGPAGQDWGLAAFSPDALRRSGFDAFLATIRAAMRHAGGVRIDHAMSLRRLWIVPRGAGPTEGAYLAYPFEDLLRLLVLESARARAIVVAEDLGTVPDGFREALAAHAIQGMRVLWFERWGEAFKPPAHWDAGAAALTTTHDLPTVAGWWRGRDLDWAEKIGGGPNPATERAARGADRAALWRACVDAGTASGPAPPPETPDPAIDAAVGFVAATPCRLAIVAAEDLLGVAEQPNRPGTTTEHPNWRRRLPVPAERLFEDGHAARRAAILNRTRPR